MGEVVRFPIGTARDAGPFCPPLDLHFPALYRTVQTVDAAELNLADENDRALLQGYIDYTLNPDRSYTGKIKRHKVTHIEDETSPSLVIRHHPDEKSAQAYLSCMIDLGASEMSEPVHGTSSGIFTLIRRPTPKEWPGPMLLYVAEYMQDGLPLDWCLAIGPTGKTVPCDSLESTSR